MRRDGTECTNVMIASFENAEDFRGAYTAGAHVDSHNRGLVFWSVADPNVRESIEVYRSTPDFLRSAEITQEDLNGSILSAYSRVTAPEGEWAHALNAIHADILGLDEGELLDMIKDIKNADLSMQADAAASLEKRLANASCVTFGNTAKIDADADIFDKVTDFMP